VAAALTGATLAAGAPLAIAALTGATLADGATVLAVSARADGRVSGRIGRRIATITGRDHPGRRGQTHPHSPHT
jgi:hypothetical protein